VAYDSNRDAVKRVVEYGAIGATALMDLRQRAASTANRVAYAAAAM
jgi:hypothetical protein